MTNTRHAISGLLRLPGLVALSLLVLSCTDPSEPGEDFLACDQETLCPDTIVQSFCDSETNTCIAPPSPEACNAIESCSDPELPICSDPGGGQCVQCVDTTGCDEDQVCDLNTNSCVAIQCEPGQEGDAFCGALDAEHPFCSATDTCGACKTFTECTTAEAPACDPETFACRECQANSECGSGHCETESGTCTAEADIIHVAAVGVETNCGSAAQPCRSISIALGLVTASRNVILVEAGTYVGKITITEKDVTIVGVGNVNLNPTNSGDTQPTLKIDGSISVSLEDLTFRGGSNFIDEVDCRNEEAILHIKNTSFFNAKHQAVRSSCTTDIRDCEFQNNDIAVSVFSGSTQVDNSLLLDSGTGISCVGESSISVSNVKIVDGQSFGISVLDCELNVDSSEIFNFQGIGLIYNGGNFSITNSFVSRNARGVKLTRIDTLQTQQFDFNTVAQNFGTNFICSQSVPFTAVGNIIEQSSASNNIHSSCQFKFSNIEGGAPGEGNLNVDSRFVNPVAGPDGDYHLQSSSPLIDTVPASASDVTTDFDGDLRPGNGMSDMGADEAN